MGIEMPDKITADLEEMANPKYAGCPGANCEEYRYESEEITLHTKNLQATHFLEYDRKSREYRPVPMPMYARD
jgi:hypothetical protein